jgi:hypothetical protein
MSPRKFDRYMVHVGMGTHAKLAALTDNEYRAHISGVLAIAAEAPVRGYLIVGEQPAEPVHIARVAGVTEKVAAAAVEKLKAVGILTFDVELEAWEVHDWLDHNPDPKRDVTAAERAKRYRERKRHASANGAVTPPVTPPSRVTHRDGHATVTPPEVEVEVEEKANAFSSAVAEQEQPDAARLCNLLASLIVANDPKAKVAPDSKGWRDAARRLLALDDRPVEQIEQVIRWSQADPFWRANVLSMPKLRDKYGQLLLKMQTPVARQGARPGWSTEEILAAGRNGQ